MRRTKRSGSFWLILLINLLLNLEGTIPAVLLLIAHFLFDISVWWAAAALGLWILGMILWMKLMGWASACGDDKPVRENKNPYSVKSEKNENR